MTHENRPRSFWHRLVHGQSGALTIGVAALLSGAWTAFGLLKGGASVYATMNDRDLIVSQVSEAEALNRLTFLKLQKAIDEGRCGPPDKMNDRCKKIERILRESGAGNDRLVSRSDRTMTLTLAGVSAESYIGVMKGGTVFRDGVKALANLKGGIEVLHDLAALGPSQQERTAEWLAEMAEMRTKLGLPEELWTEVDRFVLGRTYDHYLKAWDEWIGATPDANPAKARAMAGAQTVDHRLESDKRSGQESGPEGAFKETEAKVVAKTDPSNPNLRTFGDFRLIPDDATRLMAGSLPQALGLIDTPNGPLEVTITATADGYRAEIPGVEQVIRVSDDLTASAEDLEVLFPPAVRTYLCSGSMTVHLGEGDVETLSLAWTYVVTVNEDEVTLVSIWDDGDRTEWSGPWDEGQVTYGDAEVSVSMTVGDESIEGTVDSPPDYGSFGCVRVRD